MGKIVVPEIWIPKYKEAEIGAAVGVWGELEWQLIDTGNFFKPTVVRKGKQKNLIVDAGINGIQGVCCHDSNFLKINVGLGTTEPNVSDTALVSPVLATTKTRKSVSAITVSELGIARRQTLYQLDENEANGDLTEWGVFTSGSKLWCRELFRDQNGDPVVVTKTDAQIFVLTYNCYYKRASDDPSIATITIDGTNYECATLINNAQLPFEQHMPKGNYSEAGTSNAASNIGDALFNMKGTSIGSGRSETAIAYIDKSLVRETKVMADLEQWNGNIGEIVWGQAYGHVVMLARTTFNPVFPKTSAQKLYITFKRTTVRV